MDVPPGTFDGPPSADPEAFARAKAASVAQVLFRAARLFEGQVLARMPPAPSGDRLRPSHTAVFPHLDLGEGTRQTELARRMGISKQAVGQVVGELERMGVVARVPDPEDRRAKRVVFTEREGLRLTDGLAHLRDYEAELAAAIGPERMAALHEGLLALLAELERREHAPERPP